MGDGAGGGTAISIGKDRDLQLPSCFQGSIGMYAIDFTDGLYQLCFVGFVDGVPACYIVEAFAGLYGNGCKGIGAQVFIVQMHRGEGGKGD